MKKTGIHKATLSVLRWGSLIILLVALLVGTLWRGAYFPTPPDEFSFSASIYSPRWTFVALLLLAGVWELVALLVERRSMVLRSPLLWIFTAFTLYSGATYFWSSGSAITIKDFVLLLALASVLLVVRGQLIRFPAKVPGMLSWWLVYTAGFVSAWGIVTYILRTAPYANEVDGIYRAGSTLEYSNALGCFALMAIPFATALLGLCREEERPLPGTALTLLTAAVLLSLSRSALVLLVLVSLYLLIANRGSTRFLPVFAGLGLGVVLAVIAMLAAEAGQRGLGITVAAVVVPLAYFIQEYLPGAGREKVVKISYIFGVVLAAAGAVALILGSRIRHIIIERFGEGFTWSRMLPHREDTWSGALDAFRERPVKGWGLGSFPQVYQDFSFTSFTKYAHNLVLQVAVDSGIIGAVLMVLFLLYVAVFSLLRLARHAEPLARAAAIAALIFIFFNMFDWEWYVPALAAWFLVVAALVEQMGDSEAVEVSAD
jgi:hypothetical protein